MFAEPLGTVLKARGGFPVDASLPVSEIPPLHSQPTSVFVCSLVSSFPPSLPCCFHLFCLLCALCVHACVCVGHVLAAPVIGECVASLLSRAWT